MTYFSHFSLQAGIYSLLSADASLSVLVSGIYDQAPDRVNYPFVTLGESTIRDWSNAEKNGTEQQVTLRIFSRAPGRKETAQIMERIVALLHGGGLSVSGQAVQHVRFQTSSIDLLDDGRTTRGTLSFRVLLTEV